MTREELLRGWPVCGKRASARSGCRTSRCCCCGCSATSRRPAAAPPPIGRRARQPADQRFRPVHGQRGRSPAAGGHAVRAPGARTVGSTGRGGKGNRAGRAGTPRLAAGTGSGGPPAAPVERLLADPGTIAAATVVLEQHFTPVLAELICAAVDLDVAALDLAGNGRTCRAVRSRPRRRGFAEEVLRAYAYQCAMCGFDGALGRYPVGIEAAHVRWHSQEGPGRDTERAGSLRAAPRAVRPGRRRHHRGPADQRIRPVRRQE